MNTPDSCLTALGARVHLFLRPEDHDDFVSLFRDALGCDVVELDFGLPYSIVLVSFSDGSAFSIEFTELAPAPAPTIDDVTAFRGAWIEFRTNDLEGCQQRLREAGVPEFRHAGSQHIYFSAPGGQVFRLLHVSYRGP